MSPSAAPAPRSDAGGTSSAKTFVFWYSRTFRIAHPPTKYPVDRRRTDPTTRRDANQKFDWGGFDCFGVFLYRFRHVDFFFPVDEAIRLTGVHRRSEEQLGGHRCPNILTLSEGPFDLAHLPLTMVEIIVC